MLRYPPNSIIIIKSSQKERPRGVTCPRSLSWSGILHYLGFCTEMIKQSFECMWNAKKKLSCDLAMGASFVKVTSITSVQIKGMVPLNNSTNKLLGKCWWQENARLPTWWDLVFAAEATHTSDLKPQMRPCGCTISYSNQSLPAHYLGSIHTTSLPYEICLIS